jgi:hypothetical protein
MKAIQYVEEVVTLDEARDIMDSLCLLDEFLGQELVAPSSDSPLWKVKAYFQAGVVQPDTTLPTGCSLVTLPRNYYVNLLLKVRV